MNRYFICSFKYEDRRYLVVKESEIQVLAQLPSKISRKSGIEDTSTTELASQTPMSENLGISRIVLFGENIIDVKVTVLQIIIKIKIVPKIQI